MSLVCVCPTQNLLTVAAGANRQNLMDIISPNAGLAFWLVIIFLILLWVLRKYAWKPITDALTIREQTIEESIARAEKALAEAKAIAADNEKARREGEMEAQRIVRDAREASEQLRQAEMDRTREQIARMQSQATEEIDREKQHALEALRTEVADLAIRAAELVIKEKMDDATHRKMVDSFIGDLERN